jgi:hypothetical protein
VHRHLNNRDKAPHTPTSHATHALKIVSYQFVLSHSYRPKARQQCDGNFIPAVLRNRLAPSDHIGWSSRLLLGPTARTRVVLSSTVVIVLMMMRFAVFRSTGVIGVLFGKRR